MLAHAPRPFANATRRRVGGGAPGVARRAASMDLRAPPIAVWPGEVVLVAVPDARELCALVAAARRYTTVRCAAVGWRVAEARPAYGPPDAGAAPALAATAVGGVGVVVPMRLRPGTSARRALAALRIRIARTVPCRCVWLIGGRVYPE